jgi:hypothetical protein
MDVINNAIGTRSDGGSGHRRILYMYLPIRALARLEISRYVITCNDRQNVERSVLMLPFFGDEWKWGQADHRTTEQLSVLLSVLNLRLYGYTSPRPQMTPVRLMRTLLPSRHASHTSSNAASAVKAVLSAAITTTTSSSSAECDPTSCLQNCRCFAQVSDIDRLNRDVFFTPTPLRFNVPGQQDDHQPPDERTLQLGKTVRILHESLPTLLQSPLPGEILSPQITLHLFPSTHPHLPTVSGRIGYIAALWTAPVAWGRVPLVGNVKLTILSERMVRNGGTTGPHENRDEKLIVKWKTCGKTKHRDGTGGIYRGVGLATKDPVDKIKEFVAGTAKDESQVPPKEEQEFQGIFVFEFDEEGRIVKHVIEHTDEGGRWDRMTRVVSVTDWLLGRFNGKKDQMPELALCEERPTGGAIGIVDRRGTDD